MAKAIPLPVEGDDHLVEPPIIDFLHHDPVRHMYVVTFVPHDDVSRAETEVVEIPEDSDDGHTIAWQLEVLASLWGPSLRIQRIAHSGGGDFEFHLEDGTTRSLSADSQSSDVTFQAYGCLRYMSLRTEIAPTWPCIHPPAGSGSPEPPARRRIWRSTTSPRCSGTTTSTSGTLSCQRTLP